MAFDISLIPTDDTSMLDFQELKNELTTQGKMAFTVATGSMEPLISAKSEIIVAAAKNLPEKFDIVVFEKNNELICHYVWHVNELPHSNGERIINTRGLNTKWDDLPVLESEVLGKVVSHKIGGLTRLRIGLTKYYQRRFRRGIIGS